MSLMIEVPPELERRLREEADRRGQAATAYALSVLEHELDIVDGSPRLLPDGLPADSPEDLVRLAQEQGVAAVDDIASLMGDWSDDDGADDTDVEAFLAARQAWKWAGGPGFPSSMATPPTTRTSGSAGSGQR